jgi:polar amino acid transport system substrate-binding protein
MKKGERLLLIFALIGLILCLTGCGKTEGINSIISFFQGVSQSFYNNIILEDRYLLILDGLKTTVIISILSLVFGTLLGALLCYMSICHNKVLNSIAKVYIMILQGTPVLVLLMIIFYVIFASVNINAIFISMIAFGLNFAASASEIFSNGIKSVDKGQTEAGIAMGFTKTQTFVHIILPQAIRRIMPIYQGEFINMVKETSVVGYIAVQDLTKASDIIRSRTFDAFFPLIIAAAIYFVITWLLILVLSYVERRINPKATKRQVRKAA